jgi:hypothetical protein
MNERRGASPLRPVTEAAPANHGWRQKIVPLA